MSQHCEDGTCSPEGNASATNKHGSAPGIVRIYLPALISFLLLISGLLIRHYKIPLFNSKIELIWFGSAYLIVGGSVLLKAMKSIPKGDIFNEFFLMSIATLGAFGIGEYPEGVAVMLFYNVGELFQGAAVSRARRSIKDLLEIKTDKVTVLEKGNSIIKSSKEVQVGETIQLKAGEQAALDGILLSARAAFNTAALTGESVPQTLNAGETVLAGMINLTTVVEIKVTCRYENTKLSKILAMVMEATSRKARTQRFISKFAKVYTPIVVLLAVLLVTIPYFIADEYIFSDWLYRSLVFLVISCPCALVVSIPLGYFGGIGAASANGILFKGSDFLDLMRKIDTVVMDKTGTLTKGVFNVQEIKVENFDQHLFLQLVSCMESHSTHPVAKAITAHASVHTGDFKIKDVEEIAGHGLKGNVNGYEILTGNPLLLKKSNIVYDPELDNIAETIVAVAINGKYAGSIQVADEIKDDSIEAIRRLRAAGIKNIIMLSGDKDSITRKVAKQLNIDQAYGSLLPDDKITAFEKLKREGKTIAFAGDGINDSPTIALADVGIAMGGLGSDVAIETADVVIQSDQPSKIATSIAISKATHRIVWQNISFAIGIKAIVLIMGAGGIATMWEAVFADVGVALLAILNAVRIQKMTFL